MRNMVGQRQSKQGCRWLRVLLTIGHTLRVVVGLRMLDVNTDEFEINFVFYVGHHDEGCHDTLALAGG